MQLSSNHHDDVSHLGGWEYFFFTWGTFSTRAGFTLNRNTALSTYAQFEFIKNVWIWIVSKFLQIKMFTIYVKMCSSPVIGKCSYLCTSSSYKVEQI